MAVVGPPAGAARIGGEVFANLMARGFPGAIYPVNCRADVVQSVRAYRSVCDLPEPIDLAVLVLPHREVLSAVDDCVRHGVKALVVIGAGFAETGEEGAALQKGAGGPRSGGRHADGRAQLPGLLNTEPGRELNATFAPTWPPAGNVAFSSQSGALGLSHYARSLGIGISQFVSVGNRARRPRGTT